MKLKGISSSIVGGACTCLGYMLMASIIETCFNQSKRAAFIRKVRNVKEALMK